MRIKPSHVYIFDDKEKLLGDRVREETIFSLFSHSLSPSRCLVILIDRSGVGNWKDWIEEQKKKKKNSREDHSLQDTTQASPLPPCYQLFGGGLQKSESTISGKERYCWSMRSEKGRII